MVDGRLRLTIAVLAVLAGVSSGQPKNPAAQSPRQALVEMFSGGEGPFKKHLTAEMQQRLREMKGSAQGVPLLGWGEVTANDPDHFQVFDLGPILFSFNNPEQHERYELKIDSEEARGDEDSIGLSLHYLRGGVEQPAPLGLRFVMNMKRQEGTWRLNAVTLSATLPVGDPRILEQSWWGPAQLLAGNNNSAPDNGSPMVVDDRPKLSPLRAVRMIGMAENIYAQNHPGLGYTCRLSDLVNVGKGLDEDGVYKFMDAAFAGGTYNGYRFTISGCDHRPARTFRVMAEPVAGKGKAYCSDHNNNLRASDDGRGSTCLISGKIARK